MEKYLIEKGIMTLTPPRSGLECSLSQTQEENFGQLVSVPVILSCRSDNMAHFRSFGRQIGDFVLLTADLPRKSHLEVVKFSVISGDGRLGGKLRGFFSHALT